MRALNSHCLIQNKMNRRLVITLIIFLADHSYAGISFRNVRRSPVRYRPARIENDNSDDRNHNEGDMSDDSIHYPPRLRRRPPFHERVLNSISGLIPTLPSFNIIKRSGGFHRFRRLPPQDTRNESDLRRVTTVNHRIGQNIETSTRLFDDKDQFENKINQFRIGLMVNDPRANFYNSQTLHEVRDDDFDRNNLETDVRKNLLYKSEKQRRRRGPRRPPDVGPHISPGPPYPGPNPRNPRLPLDKTIIFP